MDSMNVMPIDSPAASAPVVREYDVGGKDYVVKSVFIGNKDVKATLLRLAEIKAIKEMGLDCLVP